MTEQESNEQEFKIDLPSVANMFTPPQDVCFVTKADSLKKAWTIMKVHGFSQLLVVKQKPTGDTMYNQVVGCFSWESFAFAAVRLGKDFSLEHPIEPFVEKIGSGKFVRVEYTEPVIDVAKKLQDHEYVIATDADGRVKAFITPYDVSKMYFDLVKPYSELQKIELCLKSMVQKIPSDKIDAYVRKNCKENGGEVKDSSRLVYGDYKSLFESEWLQDWPFDKKVFLEQLNEVQKIRNKVMHFEFKTKTLEEDEIMLVSRFGNMLQDYILPFPK